MKNRSPRPTFQGSRTGFASYVSFPALSLLVTYFTTIRSPALMSAILAAALPRSTSVLSFNTTDEREERQDAERDDEAGEKQTLAELRHGTLMALPAGAARRHSTIASRRCMGAERNQS